MREAKSNVLPESFVFALTVAVSSSLGRAAMFALEDRGGVSQFHPHWLRWFTIVIPIQMIVVMIIARQPWFQKLRNRRR